MSTRARPYASRPLKQAVISASALSLLYPQDGIDGYPQDAFIADLLDQAEIDIRGCFEAGADSVQIDFTEGRLALKLDPSGGVLKAFVDLNNQLLERFTRRGAHADRRPHLPGRRPRLDPQRRRRLRRAPAGALPRSRRAASTFSSRARPTAPRVLQAVADNSQTGQKIFVGVTDPIDPRVESAEEVRDRVLEAARFIPLDRLGTTDDCGFSPFGDDTSTARDTAFAKIQARIDGTRLAEAELGV